MQNIFCFTTLNDFISFRKECIFCNKLLTPILTNFVGANRGLKISDINVPLTGDNFVFKLVFHTPSVSIDEECSINIYTNEFMAGRNLNFSDFHHLGPHLELQCRNIKCKNNYYISSSIFTAKSHDDKHHINDLIVDMECFNIPKFWVQNDHISNLTKIFSTKNPDLSPVEIPLILLNSIEKDKLINKIKTAINFS